MSRIALLDRVSGALIVTPLTTCLFGEVSREIAEVATPVGSARSPLVFDLQNVESIDSVFLSVLVALAGRGRPVAIAGVNPHIRQVLQVTRVDKAVRVCRDVLAAVAVTTGEGHDDERNAQGGMGDWMRAMGHRSP